MTRATTRSTRAHGRAEQQPHRHGAINWPYSFIQKSRALPSQYASPSYPNQKSDAFVTHRKFFLARDAAVLKFSFFYRNYLSILSFQGAAAHDPRSPLADGNHHRKILTGHAPSEIFSRYSSSRPALYRMDINSCIGSTTALTSAGS